MSGPETPPTDGRLMGAVMRRVGLGNFLRVADRRTMRALAYLGLASIAVSLLEVAALAAVQPLVTLLSGGSLEQSGAMGQLAERWIGGLDAQGQALAMVGFVVILLVARAVFSAVLRWWTIGAITEGSARATTGLLEAYIGAPLAFHAQRNSAQSTRTAAISIISIYAAGLLGISTAMSEIAVIVLVGLLLTFVTPLGALSAVLYFGTAMLLYNRFVQRRTSDASRRRDQLQASWLALLQQALGGLREIRLRGAEAEYIGAFSAARERQNHTERRIIFAAEFGRYYLEAAFMLGFGVLATVVLLTQGDNSAAVLGLLLAAGFRLLPSASRLLNAFSRIREGEGSMSLLLDELDAMGRTSIPEQTGNWVSSEDAAVRPAPRPPMSAEFQNAFFQYPGASGLAIRGVSGRLEAGRSLGIVGPSGAGKTTVVDLLCGLLTPTSGSILIDGSPTTGDDRAWQKSIAYVPQEIFLLDASLRQNIAFTTGPVDEVRLAHAVEFAQLEDWVQGLPDGLLTQVGERGVLLSGGQRQRIGIARALYRNPSLLILDEATSALDVETEAFVTSAISSLAGGLTLVVVAHRLSTVRGCDEILVLDDGEAIGWGSFTDLSTSNPMFSRWLELAGMTQPTT
jgi:ABC-type multidrug transport system fused ATPase/permease subunit